MNIHHLELQPTAPSLSSAAGGHFEADQSPHSLSYRLPSDDDEPHPADFEDHSDDGGESVSSLVDEDVNFNYVYALFEFPAMVEGQLTVYQGERMVLLQDDNPYWWLVHLPRTREIGYIPADNVETAPEKLARVNRRKNLQLCKPSSTEGASDLDLLIAAQNPNNPLPPRGLPPHNAAATEPPTKKSNQNGASVRFHEYLVTAAFDAYSYSGSDYEDSDNDDSYIPGYIADGDQHHGEDDDEGHSRESVREMDDSDSDGEAEMSPRQRRRVSATVPKGVLKGSYRHQPSIDYSAIEGLSDDDDDDVSDNGQENQPFHHGYGYHHEYAGSDNQQDVSDDANVRHYQVAVTFHSPDPYMSLEHGTVEIKSSDCFSDILFRLYTLFELNTYQLSHCGLFVQVNSASEAYPVDHKQRVSFFLDQLVHEFNLGGHIPYEGSILPQVMQLHLKLYPEELHPELVNSPTYDTQHHPHQHTSDHESDNDSSSSTNSGSAAAHNTQGPDHHQMSHPDQGERRGHYDNLVKADTSAEREPRLERHQDGNTPPAVASRPYSQALAPAASSSEHVTDIPRTTAVDDSDERDDDTESKVSPRSSGDGTPPSTSALPYPMSAFDDNGILTNDSTSNNHHHHHQQQQPQDQYDEQRSSTTSSIFSSNRNSLVLDDRIINQLKAVSAKAGPSSRARHISIQPPPRSTSAGLPTDNNNDNSNTRITRPLSLPFDHVPVIDGKEPPAVAIANGSSSKMMPIADSREVVKNMLRSIPKPKSKPPPSAIARARDRQRQLLETVPASAKRKSIPADSVTASRSPVSNSSCESLLQAAHDQSLKEIQMRPRSEIPAGLTRRPLSTMSNESSYSAETSITIEEKQQQRLKALNAICKESPRSDSGSASGEFRAVSNQDQLPAPIDSHRANHQQQQQQTRQQTLSGGDISASEHQAKLHSSSLPASSAAQSRSIVSNAPAPTDSLSSDVVSPASILSVSTANQQYHSARSSPISSNSASSPLSSQSLTGKGDGTNIHSIDSKDERNVGSENASASDEAENSTSSALSSKLSATNPNRSFGHRRSNSLRRISIQNIRPVSSTSSLSAIQKPTAAGPKPTVDTRQLQHQVSAPTINQVPTPPIDEVQQTMDSDLPLDDWLMMMRGSKLLETPTNPTHSMASSDDDDEDVGTGSNDYGDGDEDIDRYIRDTVNDFFPPTPSPSPESQLRRHILAGLEDKHLDGVTVRDLTADEHHESNYPTGPEEARKSGNDVPSSLPSANIRRLRHHSTQGVISAANTKTSSTDNVVDIERLEALRQVEQLRAARSESKAAIEAIDKATRSVDRRLNSLEADLDNLVCYLVQVIN